MAYRIEYDSDRINKFSTSGGKSRLPWMIAGAFLLFLLLTNSLWPAGADRLRRLLIPGEPDVTVTAFSHMVEDLRAGEPVPDAAESFCREIFESAGYSG